MEIPRDIRKLTEIFSVLLKESERIKERDLAETIKDEIIKGEGIVHEISKKFHQSDELNSKEKLEMEKEIRNLKKKVTELEAKMKILEEDEADNKKQIACLEHDLRQKDVQIIKLNEKVERGETKFKEMENALQTGQIAFEFEKDLAKYIYPHDKKFSSRKIFTSMKKWLEDKKDTKQGREANERWKALKDEFSWSSKHEEVFFKLLESRRKYAHPAVDQSGARFSIPDCFTVEEKKCIEVINKMIERVGILLQQ